MQSLLIALLILSCLQGVGLLVVFLRKKDEGVTGQLTALSGQSERLERGLRDELVRTREEQNRGSRELREEVTTSIRAQNESGLKQITVLNQLTQSIELKLNQIQDSNTRKLEEMRQTVDEKLQGTLEKRLGDSFKIVSDRLEAVHKGLGEMQTLASGVGDLKRVLTNVKTRGTWGEVQLRAILEQILVASQFSSNVKIQPDKDHLVEFAVRLPGRDALDKPVWLPIDSKFPKEDYERIMEAHERADVEALKTARDGLARSIRESAKTIRTLYIVPPHSTDFGILFVPTEGLFAEICQYPGLLDQIQRDSRVTIAGPTTMATLLNSLQVGFQTLAIQQRSSEVWELLGAVKSEFGKFGDFLDAVEKKLDEAKNKISSVRSKSTTISRKLKKVEEVPHERTDALLGLDSDSEDEAET